MKTEVIFKKHLSDFKKVDTSKYTQIYINKEVDDKTTKLSLSKYSGDILYILSNKDLEDVNDYFKQETIVESPNLPEKKINVKKSKQGK